MKRGFRVANIWSFKSKMSKHRGYRFGLNGKTNLQKWINEIGFSNPYKLERAISYLKNNMGVEGIEPPTNRASGDCSPNELHSH